MAASAGSCASTGSTCDNLVACEVVTAEGKLVRASPDEHADLFWSLQGGGGNFGIVTRFEYRLHPVGPEVLAGVVLYPAEEAGEVLRSYRDCVAGAPEELTTIVILTKAPPAPFLPEHLHGRPVMILAVCYAGDLAEGKAALAPLRTLAEPLIDLIEPKPYVEHQGMLDAGVPHGLRYYWKSHYLSPLSDASIDALIEHAWAAPSPQSYTIMFHLGGAIRRRSPANSAFEDRSAEHALNIDAVWSDPETDAAQIAWVRRMFEATQSFATGVYVNFLGEEGEERVRAAYGPEKYRAPGADQGEVRPREPVPREPEHPAGDRVAPRSGVARRAGGRVAVLLGPCRALRSASLEGQCSPRCRIAAFNCFQFLRRTRPQERLRFPGRSGSFGISRRRPHGRLRLVPLGFAR